MTVMRSNQVLLCVIGADDKQVGRAVATQHARHDDISSAELIAIENAGVHLYDFGIRAVCAFYSVCGQKVAVLKILR